MMNLYTVQYANASLDKFHNFLIRFLHFTQCSSCYLFVRFDNRFYSFLGIFWRARVCRPFLCFCRPICIFESCLDSNPESCRSKQASYQLSHPSPFIYPLGCIYTNNWGRNVQGLFVNFCILLQVETAIY
jgi:hypothetical protein